MCISCAPYASIIAALHIELANSVMHIPSCAETGRKVPAIVGDFPFFDPETGGQPKKYTQCRRGHYLRIISRASLDSHRVQEAM